MNLRDALAVVLARDSRYAIPAYAFVFESLEYAKTLKRQRLKRGRRGRVSLEGPLHVTGQELCLAARELALRQYGMLALVVLEQWGVRSTSDLGEIVYNLIASGDFEKTPTDSRADFDNVFDFESAFRTHFEIVLDDVA
jgi:uncharacterized repeat protein (TIGR04138 family)